MEEIKKALDLDPNNNDVLIEAGWKYLNSGRFDEAYRLFRKALALNPRASQNYWSLGWLYVWLGEYGKGEHWAKKLLEIHPDDVPAQEMLMRIYLTQNRLEEAAEMNRRALLMAPDRSTNLHRAALLAWKMGREAEALDYARQTGGTTLAAILLKTGESAEAETILDKALQGVEGLLERGGVRSVVDSGGAYGSKARVSAVRGETDEVCRCLRQAYERGFREFQVFTGFPYHLEDAACFQQLLVDTKADVDAMRHRLEELEKEWEQ